MQLLSCLVDGVHLVVRGATGTANGDEIFLVYLMCEFRKFAFLAADIFHNEFVEVFLHVLQSVLSLNDSRTFRVGAYLNAEEFQDGTFGCSQGTSHIYQVCNVCLDTVQSAFLTQSHLRHFVPIVWVVILSRRDANVCHIAFSFGFYSLSERFESCFVCWET